MWSGSAAGQWEYTDGLEARQIYYTFFLRWNAISHSDLLAPRVWVCLWCVGPSCCISQRFWRSFWCFMQEGRTSNTFSLGCFPMLFPCATTAPSDTTTLKHNLRCTKALGFWWWLSFRTIWKKREGKKNDQTWNERLYSEYSPIQKKLKWRNQMYCPLLLRALWIFSSASPAPWLRVQIYNMSALTAGEALLNGSPHSSGPSLKMTQCP